MADKRAIGVFDSGLGGLTVVKELMKILPNENIVYFGDTGRVPYGTRSKETICKYALQDEKFLLSKDVKLIIAACGTVSSVATETSSQLPVPFFEVVSHAAKEAVETTKNGKIGVIGTAATIKSGQHKNSILKLMPEATVTANSCTMFVPLVEEGWFSSDDVVVLETVRRYLQPIVDSESDTLILGCTHYPVLSDPIKKIVGDNVKLINAGCATANAVKQYLAQNDLENNENCEGNLKFFVTDKLDTFKNLASLLLGKEIEEPSIEQVDITDL